jgi:hypothetical protein
MKSRTETIAIRHVRMQAHRQRRTGEVHDDQVMKGIVGRPGCSPRRANP